MLSFAEDLHSCNHNKSNLHHNSPLHHNRQHHQARTHSRNIGLTKNNTIHYLMRGLVPVIVVDTVDMLTAQAIARITRLTLCE